MIIRTERSGDIAAIRTIHDLAFGGTVESRIVEALRAANKLAVSLVAEQDGGVVGHIAFSPVNLADRTDGLGLAPLAVDPGFQRRGIGGQLIEKGLAAAAQRGAGFVVVLGPSTYYSKFGFKRASDYCLRNEYSADEEFRVIELREGALPPSGGLVKYGPEFSI